MMKYLLVLIAVLVGIGIWRSRRPQQVAPPPKKPPVQDMVACAHCGVHLPRSDALLQGPHAFCCADHRQRGATGPS